MATPTSASRYTTRMPSSGVLGVSSRPYVPEPLYRMELNSPSTAGSGARGTRMTDISRNLGRLSQALETLRQIEGSPGASAASPHKHTSPLSSFYRSPAKSAQSYSFSRGGVRTPITLTPSTASSPFGTTGLEPGSDERNRVLEDAIRQSRERIASLKSMIPSSRRDSADGDVVSLNDDSIAFNIETTETTESAASSASKVKDNDLEQHKHQMSLNTELEEQHEQDLERISDLERQVQDQKAKSAKMKDIIRRQQEQVRRTLEDQRNAVDALSTNHQDKMEKARREIKKGRQRVKKLEGDLKLQAEEITELKSKNAEMSEELQSLMADSMKEQSEGKAHKAGAAAALMRIQALQSRAREAANLRKDALRQRDEAISSATQWKERSSELEDQVQKLLEKVNERQAGVASMKSKLETTMHSLDEAERAGRRLARENEALRAKVEALQAGLEEQVQKRVEGINDLDSAAESAVGWKDRAESLENELKSTQEELEFAREQSEGYKKRIIELESDLTDTQREVKAKEQSRAMIDVEREASMAKVEETKESAMKQLQQAVQARIAAINDRDQAIDSAKRWKEEAERLEEKIEHDQKKLEQLMQSRVDAAQDGHQAASSAEAWKKRAEELDDEVKELQGEVKALKQSSAIHQVLGDAHATNQEELEATQHQLAEAQKKLESVVQGRTELIKERDEILKEREEAAASAEAWKEHAEQIESELNDLKSGVHTISSVASPAPPPPTIPVQRELKYEFDGDDESFEDFVKLAKGEGGKEKSESESDTYASKLLPIDGGAGSDSKQENEKEKAEDDGQWDNLFPENEENENETETDQHQHVTFEDEEMELIDGHTATTTDATTDPAPKISAADADRYIRDLTEMNLGLGSTEGTGAVKGEGDGNGSDNRSRSQGVFIRKWREGTVYEKGEGVRLGGFSKRKCILYADRLVLYGKEKDKDKDTVYSTLQTASISIDATVPVPDKAKHPYRFAVNATAEETEKETSKSKSKAKAKGKKAKAKNHVLAFDSASDKADWMRDIKNVSELAHGDYSLTTLGLASKEELIERIFEDDMAFLNTVIDETDVNDLDKVLKPLLAVLMSGESIMEWNGTGKLKTMCLIESHINEEVERTHDPETLFRTNSRATKLIREALIYSCAPFLRNVLQEVIDDLMNDEDGPDLEIDPAKLPADINPSVLSTNQTNLRDYAMMVVDNLQSQSQQNSLPPVITSIVEHLSRVVKTKFSGYEHVIMGGALFLRYICPAILAPHKFGLVDETDIPSATAQRRLILLAKVLQNMSNNVFFGAKEPFMGPINAVIENGTPLMHKCFDAIVQNGEEVNLTADETVGVHIDVESGAKCLSEAESDNLRLHCLRMAVKLPFPK